MRKQLTATDKAIAAAAAAAGGSGGRSAAVPGVGGGRSSGSAEGHVRTFLQAAERLAQLTAVVESERANTTAAGAYTRPLLSST